MAEEEENEDKNSDKNIDMDMDKEKMQWVRTEKPFRRTGIKTQREDLTL